MIPIFPDHCLSTGGTQQAGNSCSKPSIICASHENGLDCPPNLFLYQLIGLVKAFSCSSRNYLRPGPRKATPYRRPSMLRRGGFLLRPVTSDAHLLFFFCKIMILEETLRVICSTGLLLSDLGQAAMIISRSVGDVTVN